MASPMPVPLPTGLVVKNGSKILFNRWAGMPVPVSQTDSSTAAVDTASAHYVLNTSSKKYHDPSCSAVGKMSEKNRRDFTGTQAELEKEGYTPHTSCIQ